MHHALRHLGNLASPSQHERSQAVETLASKSHDTEEPSALPGTSVALIAQDHGRDVVLH